MDLVIMLVAFMNLNLILGALVFKSLKLDENLIAKKATVLRAKERLVCDHFIIHYSMNSFYFWLDVYFQ